MKRQGGFTLIELVVVIVILGILAVTAAPRFLNLQSDARDASLQGLKGAMAGAAGIIYGKSAISGEDTKADGAISAGSDTIETVWGYPEASTDGITKAVTGLSTDWKQITAVSGGNSIAYGFDAAATNCYVTYAINPSTSNAEPTYTVSSCQ
ncbi:type II secretion system GspH family protein [Vibrio europaeus]|uniref:MSHA biogenesis protein MshA n=1 Tax=Vibrio europaeus TaxID=300876 RepID=A0A178JBE7_9VIBR|nr:type II secretion system protein [Vibrio europaeus]MDC5703931.1 type II secretion system protein [Vibrio europaeus]MDC5708867.1 type II secretion system GspH family protein [Vibrio europaeus]MDC5713345.1 type II secretion system GspH family protein [Vibrio europaeus]MDC5719092.1 type II secretion system GspH family protein [Vibrio europaeus]MDC5724940.1 type II secretion system GspH family protein [Vibrio europaeus]